MGSISGKTRWVRAVGTPAAAIGLAGMIVFGVGVADAANGDNLVIGHANRASATTTLKDSKGTPLSLVAPKGKAPLHVSNTTEVPRLNSALVGGLAAGQLQRRVSGSCGLGIASVRSGGSAACAPGVVVHAAPGSYPYTVPSNVHELRVFLVGGGGGGGANTAPSQVGVNGGQGALLEALLPVTSGEQLTVTVGDGGIADDGATHGSTSGGATQVVNASTAAVLLKATGGGGGGDLASGCIGNSVAAGGEPHVFTGIGLWGQLGQLGGCDTGGGAPGFAGTGGGGSTADPATAGNAGVAELEPVG